MTKKQNKRTLFKRQLVAATAGDGTIDVDKLLVAAERIFGVTDLAGDGDGAKSRRSDQANTGDDQTEELRARADQLALVNARFDAVIQGMGQGLATFDAENRLLIWNSCFAQLYRLDADTLAPGVHISRIFSQIVESELFEDPSMLDAMIAAVPDLETGQEIKHSRTDGDGRALAIKVVKLANGDWVSIHSDVSQDRNAEMALAEAENRWNFALESAGQGVWDANHEKNDIFYSPIWRQIRGLELNDAVAPLEERVHPDDKDRVLKNHPMLNAGQVGAGEIEYREKHKDGHWIWILSRGVPVAWGADKRPTRIIGSDSDTTSLKQAQTALAEAEARWNVALEGSGQGVWDCDMVSGHIYYSPMWKKMRGIGTDEQIEGDATSWFARIHPDDRDYVVESLRKQDAGLVPRTALEYREQHRDGQWIWIQSRGEPVKWDKDGTPIRFVGIDLDITVKKQMELQLADNLQVLNTTLENFPGGICLFDKDLVLTVANQGYYEVTQLDEKWFPIGSKLEDIFRFHAERGEFGEGDVEEQIATRMADARLFEEKQYVRIRPADGVALEFKRTPLLNGGFIMTVEDVTEKRKAETERARLEHELGQAQKMEALGTLASGVAHEINTPIQYISDNIRFMTDSFKEMAELLQAYRSALVEPIDPGKISETAEETASRADAIDLDFLLEEIPLALTQSLQGVNQVGTIVKAIKEFAHPGQEDKLDSDLNAIIETTLVVSRNSWKYVSEVKTNFDTDLPLVCCHPGDISQVVLNLVVNAAHAIEDAKKDGTGLIEVSTGRVGTNVEIRISDNGCGIPADSLKRIYDPFFTTKDIGKGTGQGLAISFAIISQKHGGSIECESEVGVGTTFTIRLPLAGHSAEGEMVA